MTEIGELDGTYRVALPGPGGAVVALAWSALSDTGHRRAHNEDSLAACPPYFAVADGMGGHSAGDLASAAVVARIGELAADAATSPFGEERAVEGALRRATIDIGAVADESGLGVGTTATGAVLVLRDGQPYWSVFNVGDSRVYLYEHGALRQISVDHSVVQELVDAGMITAEQAEHHPDNNIITRAVGFGAEPVPDFWLVPVRVGARLLLCSDGLSKELDAHRIEAVLAAGTKAADTAEELVMRALDEGGRDNVTVVVIDVLAAPAPAADAGIIAERAAAPDGGLDSDVEDTLPRPASAPDVGSHEAGLQ